MEPLAGGVDNVGAVIRVDDTVRRPGGPAAPQVPPAPGLVASGAGREGFPERPPEAWALASPAGTSNARRSRWTCSATRSTSRAAATT
jgi:hypothetical protein